ncbi:MAG: matrixin family metalloprotease, partial [Planctomycetota bacterium]
MHRSLAIAIVAAMAVPASAINVVIDYTYAGSFFSTGTTNGQQARATVEAAADFFSEILDDSFSRIETPDDYISTATGGDPVTFSWNWEKRFTNPSTGAQVTISNPTIPEDEFRVYVGARNLGGNILGLAGPGGWGSSQGGSWYFPSQRAEIDAITADFTAALENRDQGANDFGAWGGVITFDSPNTWNYDHTVEPTFGQSDLFSVAIHELGHTFGIGTSDEWSALIAGNTFFGLESFAANGNAYPALADPAHWARDTQSTVFGGTGQQEASMDPDITIGTRKVWTELDAAGLVDIGWDVVAPVTPDLPGDANGDGSVDLLDLDILGSEFGTSSGGLQM